MMIDEKADSSFNPSKIGLEMLFFREEKSGRKILLPFSKER